MNTVLIPTAVQVLDEFMTSLRENKQMLCNAECLFYVRLYDDQLCEITVR